MEENTWHFILGFAAQALFSARTIIQWILSEKAKKVLSPTIYWQLSLLGSVLFSLYGWLRGDFAIILGQLFSYYIYIWNLNNKQYWKTMHVMIRYIIFVLPIAALIFLGIDGEDTVDHLIDNIPLSLLLFGSAGQIVFTLRFVYQWVYSLRRNESLLPVNFWILSLAGSFLIISYGIFRSDPVLIIGQSVGFVTYSRNLYLALREKKLPV